MASSRRGRTYRVVDGEEEGKAMRKDSRVRCGRRNFPLLKKRQEGLLFRPRVTKIVLQTRIPLESASWGRRNYFSIRTCLGMTGGKVTCYGLLRKRGEERR